MIGLGESDRKSGWVISRVDEFQVRVGLGSTLNPAQPAESQPYKTTNWNWRRARGEAPLLLLYSPYLLTNSFLFFSFKPNRPLVVCFFNFQALCASIWNRGGTIIGSDADVRRWSFLLRQSPNTIPCRPYALYWKTTFSVF